MKRLQHILFLSCLKATELIEKRFIFKLLWHERLQLRIHKSMCNACKMYEKQSDIIDKTLSALERTEAPAAKMQALKESIIKKIQELYPRP